MATIITDRVNSNGKNDINRWFHNGSDRTDSDGYRRTGYYNSAPAVTRYKFTTPSEGVSKITIQKDSLGLWDGDNPCTLRNEKLAFFITTSPTSHISACYVEGAQNNPDIDGFFTMTRMSNGYYSITGEVEKTLLPNTEYYLYIFPAYKSYVWFHIYSSGAVIITLEGATGLVRIDLGDRFVSAIPYVDNGTEWKQAIPHMDNGSTWNLC